MRVLVTGGAGFIGANLVRLLLEHGHEVSVLDNFSVGRHEYLEGLPIQVIVGDVLDESLVMHAVAKHDGLVHLAAQTGVPGSLANPRKDCEVNVRGTLNLLEAARRTQEARGQEYQFVFASSNAPLGKQPPPATEDKAPHPISPYGASKLAGEGYCLAYEGAWGVGTVVLRFGNVYGPYSAHKNSVVAKFFKDILREGRITIDGDGQQTRDFIYVEDLCRAIVLALESKVKGEIFQVATGVETSILELAALVQEVVGRDVGITHGPPRRGDIRKNYSGIRKIHEQLGWQSETSLKDGLAITWKYFRSIHSALLPEGEESPSR